MKILEVIATAPGNEFKRLYMLKTKIVRNEQPEIADATYSQGHFAWGDLEKLGYAERGSRRIRNGAEEWWTYTGPNSIVVITPVSKYADGKVVQDEHRQILKTGESTNPVEVDYT